MLVPFFGLNAKTKPNFSLNITRIPFEQSDSLSRMLQMYREWILMFHADRFKGYFAVA